MRALVTGATGFIGRGLMNRFPLAAVLTRRPEAAAEMFPTAAIWRSGSAQAIAEALTGHSCEVVFHLAGEPVAQARWTTQTKRRIRESRVEGTRVLVEGINLSKVRPKVLVSASAVGFYGDQGERTLSEDSAGGDGFLADVCRDWEEQAARAEQLGVRVVSLRIGLVLGRGGGALSAMLTPFKLGLGGRLGPGTQWTPWIHIDDLVRIAIFAAEHEKLRGPVNAVAPALVRNKDFTAALGRALRRPAILPAPAFALRAVLGEFASVLLASQRVVPAKAQTAGFQFRCRDLESALGAILQPKAVSETAATRHEVLQ